MQPIEKHTIKIKIVFRYLLLLTALLLVNRASAQVSIQLQIDTSMMMAEKAEFKIAIRYEPGVQLKNLNLQYLDSINTIQNMMINMMSEDGTVVESEFEILDYGKWKPDGNGIVNIENEQNINSGSDSLVNTFKFIFWEEGTYIIPEVAVNYEVNGMQGTAQSQGQFVRVESLLPMEEEVPLDSLTLKPIKPFIAEPLLLRDYIWSIIGVLVVLGLFILALILLLRQKGNQRVVHKKVKKIPAHEIAFEKLQTLKGQRLWQDGNIKGYQSELTYIVREYLSLIHI